MKSVCILILTLIVAQLHGQKPEVTFDRLTINDGLSLSSVYRIMQDSKGFLWFGTEDGLNQYNGSGFNIYNHQPGDPNSLSHKWVEYIEEDDNGTIWTGSRRGVTAIDPSSGEMRQFVHVADSIKSFSNDTVSAMLLQGRHLWVGTKYGLNRIDVNTQWNIRIETGTGNQCKRINHLSADGQKRIWIGTCGGLYYSAADMKTSKPFVTKLPDGSRLNVRSVLAEKDTLWVGFQTGLIKYILEKDNNALARYPGIITSTAGAVQKIFRDSSGRLWLITESGLLLHQGSQNDLIIPDESRTPSLATNPVKQILEDNQGYLWYGTFGNGIYRISMKDLSMNHLQFNPAENSSLSDNTVHAIYPDRAGTIWIGTFGAGISIYNPHMHVITTLNHNPFTEQSMSSSFIWSVLEDSKGRVWMGTNGTGIDIYDPKTDTFKNIPATGLGPGTLPPGGIRDIFQAADGSIWAASDRGGLCKIDLSADSVIRYTHDPSNPRSISDNSVRTIYQDSTGNMWIGTRRGLNRFFPSKGLFKRYLHDPEDSGSLSHDFVYSAIHMDRRGNLWVGTYGGGLNKLDLSTGRFVSYRFDADDPSTISDNIVFSIYEDAKGYMWIGTNSGLNLFNPGNGKFKRYGIESGLPNEVIYGIMPDKENRLWLTTNKGISCLDLTSFSFKNYDVRDGLQSNEFNGGAYFAGESGMLYAGGVYGLNIIDPEQLKPVKNSAEVIISKIEILGDDVSTLPEGLIDEDLYASNEIIEHENRYYLKKNISYLDEIKLDYRERFFSIEFAALSHPAAEKLNYRYMMKNLEEGWTNAGNRNYVTYANMRPGTYTLIIDAVNGDGFSAKKQAELRIYIKPPFWHSPWFIASEVIFGIGLIIFIYWILLNQRTNRILREQNVAIRTANEKLTTSEKNLKELNATKDKFFSIISHDLKNPFTSVLSISELMHDNFDSTEAEEIKYGVKKIHQTNKHIYNLLENLLTWSKSQRGKLSVESTRFNLNRVIETNINVVRLDAERKGISIRFSPEKEVFAFADMEMISTVFRNLLNNAIKFTYPGKSVDISLTESDEMVMISIRDEGVGISAEDIQKLFSIEDKFKSDGTAGEKGTGLGLIICREFIEKNNGDLNVESTPGSGSTFTFSVPLAAVVSEG